MDTAQVQRRQRELAEQVRCLTAVLHTRSQQQQ